MNPTPITPTVNKKVPKGKAVHRKSRVKVPAVTISPSTQKLLDENDRIISDYQRNRKKTRIEIVVGSNKE